jgi:hypothetical protein
LEAILFHSIKEGDVCVSVLYLTSR